MKSKFPLWEQNGLMTLEDLRTYVAVVAAGNLSAAARGLNRTQPAVSQHVRKIEREVGLALLERGRRETVLTEAGNILYAAATQGLNGLARALAEIERLRNVETRSLTISTGGTTVRHFMREATTQFLRVHQRVSLRFEHASSTQQCLENLVQARADIAFVTITDRVDGLERLPVVQMPLVLLVRSDDSLAAKRRLQVSELEQIRYISLPHYTAHNRLISDSLAEYGVTPNEVAVVDDFDTASLFVEEGLGHAIVPALHAQHFAEDRKLKAVRIEGFPAITIGWAARRFHRLPMMAREFVKTFAESCKPWTKLAGTKVLTELTQVA